MILRLRGLAFVAVAFASASATVFAVPVDLSSLRYDFGAGSGLTSFTVNDGIDADANDSFTTTQSFDVGAHGGNNKHALTADVWGSETDLTGFQSLDLTIEVDPASAMDDFGNFGFIQIVGRNTDGYDYLSLVGVNLTAGTNVISAPLGVMNAARALTFDLYGGPSQNITGDVIFSVIDVELVPVPEPSSALMGLAMLAAGIAFLRRKR